MRPNLPLLGAVFTASVVAFFFASFTLADDEPTVFDRLDANKDGYVVAEEISDEHQRLFDRLLRTSDKNKDGKLSKDEFTAGASAETPSAPLPGGGPNAGRPGAPDPQAIFRRFDKDKDGSLSREEAPPWLGQAFARLDSDKDDALSQREFMAGMSRFRRDGGGQRGNMQQLARRFEQIDANQDGKVTLEEVPAEHRESFQSLLKRMDEDGDGALTKEQFARAMAAISRRPGGATSPPMERGAFGPAFAVMQALDTDRDGALSSEEIAASPQMLLKLDRNGDGKLSKEEFVVRRPSAARDNPQAARQMFQRADRDGDGALSRQEAPEFLQRGFDRIDANGDGKLTLEELQKARERFQRR